MTRMQNTARQRIGNEMPYRDDPQAPPSARLDSFGYGGYTYSNTYANASAGTNGEKTKAYPLHKKLLQQAVDVITCQPCGAYYAATDTKTTNNDPNAAIFYEDSFNDMSWSCSAGTADENGIWLNSSDTAGSIMACLVWVLISYSSLTMTLLSITGGVPVLLAMGYNVLAALALASHVKTTLTDPGAVPAAAVPTQAQRESGQKLSMCSQCQTFKPPASHHCRICNRCISRMDHHCPWMNNCVGAGNLKHFMLFLIYTWSCSVYSLLLLGWNYFFCATEDCVFHVVLVQLVRLVTLLSVGAFLFTSSMLMNVVYGVMTGVGTIDRLKKKAAGTLQDSEEESIPLRDIFGISPAWQWPLPLDPKFHDYDAVMGYATPQRLLREQMRASSGGSIVGGGSSVVTRESYSVPVV